MHFFARPGDKGQGLAEYSIIVALVAIGAILALTLLGSTTSQVFSDVVCHVQGADPAVFPNSPCGNLVAGSPSTSPTPQGYPVTVIGDAPAAYWRLNESGVGDGAVAVDQLNNDQGTYNANGGSFSGGSSGITPGAITYGPNRGSAVAFSGGTGMSAAPLTAVQGDATRTVEFWAKSSDDPTAGGLNPEDIFSTGATGTNTDMVINVQNSNTCCREGTDSNYQVYSSPGLGIVFGNTTVQVPRYNLADGNWHYVVVTLSGSTVNVYVDSVQLGGLLTDNASGNNAGTGGQPFTLASTPNTTRTNIYWGTNSVISSDRNYNGQLQEAAVYNYVLTAAQVNAHYAAGVGPNSPLASTSYSDATLTGDASNGCPLNIVQANGCAPEAYWRLGDSGHVAYDATGNDNGLYFNGPTYSGQPAFGPYAQVANSATGAADSTAFDTVNSQYSGGNNAIGDGVVANTLTAFSGGHVRSIKLWFQTSSTAEVQTLIATPPNASQSYNFHFPNYGVTLLSPLGAEGAGAGSSGPFVGVGGCSPQPSCYANGGVWVFANNKSTWVPAPYSLADGHWHYLVVESQNTTYSQQTAIWIDNTQQGGYACCPNNGWTGFQSGWIDAGGNSNFGANLNTQAADVNIGETIPGNGSGISYYFQGQLSDVAVFGYLLAAQQISHEWGQAHQPINAGCRNLTLANIAGNADGGIFGNNNGPDSATATQSCDTVGSLGLSASPQVPSQSGVVLADNYVTFYWALEKHTGANSPACYAGLDPTHQINWITGPGPWVYCYPGGYPSALQPTDPNKPYTVSMAVGPSATLTTCNGTPFPGGQTVCFYQGQDLTPCSITYGGVVEPLYFIEAQNAYSVANPTPSGAGIPLNDPQAAAAGSTLDGVPTGTITGPGPGFAVTEGQHGTALSIAGGTAATGAWAITGPTAYSNSVGQCVPGPGEQMADRPAPAPQPYGGDPCCGNGYFVLWSALSSPFIELSPANGQGLVNTPVAYAATAYSAQGQVVGDVTSGTTLSVTGAGTCDNTAHTCQAGTAGTYTVTGTYGSEQGSAVLSVVAQLNYAQTIANDHPLIWYQLDGSAPFVDSGSLNHPGTDGNSNITTGVAGIDGNGISMAGNSAIHYDATGTPTMGARTIEFWIKTNDGSRRTLFYQGPASGSHQLIDIEINAQQGGGNCGGCLRFYTDSGADIGWGAGLTDNNWHLVDITYDGSNLIRAYKDGALLGVVGTGQLNTALSPVAIGAGDYASGFNGSMDEFAIYGSQLSDSQISAHFQASAAAPATIAATTYSAAVLADSPINYYRLGESGKAYKDYGSAGYSGVAANGNLTSVTGADGNGVNDAGNDQVAFSPSALPTTGSRTIEFWVKTTDGNRHTLFYLGPSGGNQQMIDLEINSQQGGGNCGGCLRFWTQNGGDIGWSASLTDGNWHLVDVTYDGSNVITAYNNGQLLGSVTTGQLNTSLTSGPATFGAGAQANQFNGSLDETAIYGTALTQAQIIRHYCSASVTSCSLTVSPATATQHPSTPVTFISTAHNGAATLGTVSAVLSIAPNGGSTGATCNQGAQSCQATQTGSYTVTANASGVGSATAGLTVTTNPLYAQTVGADSPAAYWRLDDSGSTAVDSSGNGNTGTLNNGVGTGVGGATSDGDTAMSFNGSNQYVQAPDSAGLHPNAITVEAWIYPTANTTGEIVNKGDNNGYRFRRGTDGSILFLERGGTNVLGTSANVAPLNTWTYVVVEGSSAGLKIYINGVLAASNSNAYGAGGNTGVLQIGADSAYGEYFQGSIDEVAVYDSALTQTQITAHFNAR